MDFILGFLTSAFIVLSAWFVQNKEWKKDLEKLKDFEVWKKWKNN